MRIDVVRGRTGDVADELLDFWAGQGVLAGDAARARLPEIVCVVRNDDEAIVGSSSAYDARLPLIGNRRLWVFRRLLDPGVPAAVEPALINATFDALDEERRQAPHAPAGLCVLVTDRAVMRQLPEAVWPATKLLYAGYLPDGSQVRLRWFEEASILT